MKISVIICAYNAEKTIKKCLDSVCGQTYKELEIILVNDGSADQTLNIMQKYKENDQRIVLVDQENQGAGCAKNVGIHHATGDYITFVDSDDWIERNTYELVMEKIKQTHCDMVLFNHNRIMGNRTIRDVRPIKDEVIHLDEMGRDTYFFRYIISYNHDLGAWNKVVRRKIIIDNNIGFSDNKKTVYDDNMYSFKIICHINTIVTMSDSFYYYVINKNSITDMEKIKDSLAMGYTNLLNEFVDYLIQIGKYQEMQSVMAPLYYSLVYFGLIRLKHFGHFNVLQSLKILNEFKYYIEYMKEINKFSVRFKYITQTMRKVSIRKNWQLAGLIVLTLFQGKVIAHYALKDEVEKIEKYL